MSFKIGLGAANKQKQPSGPKKAFFGDDDLEIPSQHPSEDATSFTISRPGVSRDSHIPDGRPYKPSLKFKQTASRPVSHAANLSSQRQNLTTIEDALDIDSSIYDYDAAFDAIHAKDAAKKAERRREAEDRKSKYMENFVAAAELRKQDLTRAKEKEIQREREAEGDAFADKEKFVTGAYKKQQEELRQAEEEERKRQEKEEEKRMATGMQGFYRSVMESREMQFQEAIEATDEIMRSGKPIDIGLEREKTDVEIARELRAQGKDVLLNDEDQIVDKRDTLSAGLNITKKSAPKGFVKLESRLMTQPSWQRKSGPDLKAMRERQSRMMEDQLALVVKRAADEEAESQRQREHAAKSRKTESDVSSAKERYLARKQATKQAKTVSSTQTVPASPCISPSDQAAPSGTI